MADVSVEFGAKDTGLEKTLQQIQDEMSNLQGKVKSGELTMTELESTMKRIGQVENMEKRLKAMGDASAESSPKIKALGSDIESAGSSVQSVGGIFDDEFKRIAAAFTVGNLAAQGFQKLVELTFAAAQNVIQGFSDALDLGGRLNELSSRTGETAGKLLVLETAFKNSGLEAGAVGTAINKLQNFMQDAANGGEKQRASMQRLGISMAELAEKTPTEQMQIFADRIAGIEDPTARAAAASEVLGDKLGGKLLPLFTDFSANLEDARSKVGSLEQVMDDNAATFDAAAETIDAVKGKMAAFAAGILSETIPAVRDLGKSMEQVDAAGLGQEVGEFLSPRLEKLSFVTIGASTALKQLIDLLTTAPSSTSVFGRAINAVAESLNGFNYYMQKAINFISPMDDLWTMLEQKGRAAADAQDTAAASIADTGAAAQTATAGLENASAASDAATSKIKGLGTSAQATGQNIASAFSLASDFSPKIDQVSTSWSGVNEKILEGRNLLSENYNISESMIGKAEEQAVVFGGVNEQLTTSKDLAGLIDKTYGSHAEKLARVQASNENAKNAIASYASWVDYIANSNPDKAPKKLSEKTREARQEIEAYGKYIGEDLKRVSFPDIAKRLGIKTMGMDGSQQIDAILGHINKKLPGAKHSVVDEKASKSAVDATALEVKKSLSEAVDYSVNTGGGGKTLLAIEALVDVIKGYVDEIRGKLPIQALA
jgi:hypothetical protein